MPKSKDPRPVEEDFTPKPPPPTSTTAEVTPPTDSASASAPPTVLAAAPAPGVPAAVVAGGASGSALLVLFVLAATMVLRRRGLRRRRLTVGGPDERITGAWLEFTDALRLAGRPVPAHLAATEAAGYAAQEPEPPERRRLLRRAVPPVRAGSGLPDPGTAATAAGTATLTVTQPPNSGTLHDKTGEPAPAATAPWEKPLPAATAPREQPRPAAAAPRDRTGGLPLPPLDALVAGVNTVGFAPGHADDEQAARAGAQAVAYADALRTRRSWWRRVWWSVRPGPLRWHR
jgi:hypothetical protein